MQDLAEVSIESPFFMKFENSKKYEAIKLDQAYVIGEVLFLVGWMTAEDTKLKLLFNGHIVDSQLIHTVRRDVVKHFKLDNDALVGFNAAFKLPAIAESYKITWEKNGVLGAEYTNIKPAVLKTTRNFDFGDINKSFLLVALGVETSKDIKNQPKFDFLLVDGRGCAEAVGHVDTCSATKDGSAGIASGWLVSGNDGHFIIESIRGEWHVLDQIYESLRGDVTDLFGELYNNKKVNLGFTSAIKHVRAGEKFKLKWVSLTGIYTINEGKAEELPSDPVKAAKELFEVPFPIYQASQRFNLVDRWILEPLIANKQLSWKNAESTVREYGHSPEKPEVSIIIPLYGRLDFMEHQILEFVADKWLREKAEIIYVLDDPTLDQALRLIANDLYALHKISFKCVFGSINRGFSGANNLGIEYSKGQYVCFLNSDAFPQKTGWVKELIETLKSNKSYGIVGPRLVFANGGIQHAGMEFIYQEAISCWTNHHPMMGIDPKYDVHQNLAEMPALTGACMVMKRSVFDEVGQWDSHYLIGDFEDSDLCLKVRKAGYKLIYNPKVQLTHLERQSFKSIGQDDFKTKVVVYNASRHQNRWRKLIENSPKIIG